MSVASAEEFIKRLTNDSAFRQQFMLKSPDVVFQAAKEAGYDFTPEEVQSILRKDAGQIPSFEELQGSGETGSLMIGLASGSSHG